MRKPSYISPTSLKAWEDDVDGYYLKYMTDVRPPRLEQTKPMSVGSAFDAEIKSYLHKCLFGPGDPEFEFETIFEKQVEPQNRDWARVAGHEVFLFYRDCGAIADLMLELQSAASPPRFEFDLLGTVETTVGSVPMMGKPDVFFVSSEGARVILDWKINGYCSDRTTSPAKGYVKLRPGGQSHRDCYPVRKNGVLINDKIMMNDVDATWATQECLYAWLLGEPPGSEELIVGIEQVCGPRTKMRAASHRCGVGVAFQESLLRRIEAAWTWITGCTERADLEEQAAALSSDDPLASFVNKVSRKQ